MEGSDLRAPLSVRGRREPQPSRHIAVERVAERVGEVQRDEPRPPQRLRLSRSPEEAGRRSTASCNSRQSARWRRSAPSRSAADFGALAVCWFIPTSSRLAGEHDDLPTVRGLVVAKDVDGTVVPADLEVAVVGAVPAIDDLEHLDAAAAQFEPAWGLLAAVAGVAVDVDVPGHSVPREWAADHAAVLGESARRAAVSFVPIDKVHADDRAVFVRAQRARASWVVGTKPTAPLAIPRTSTGAHSRATLAPWRGIGTTSPWWARAPASPRWRASRRRWGGSWPGPGRCSSAAGAAAIARAAGPEEAVALALRLAARPGA